MGRAQRLLTWIKIKETPYQIAYGLLSSIYGVAALTVGVNATPSNIDENMPLWVVWVWCVSLTLGGVLMLTGRLYALGEIEASGLSIQLGGILCYLAGCAIAMLSGGNALFGIMSYGAVGLATAVRLSTVREAIRARDAAPREGG